MLGINNHVYQYVVWLCKFEIIDLKLLPVTCWQVGVTRVLAKTLLPWSQFGVTIDLKLLLATCRSEGVAPGQNFFSLGPKGQEYLVPIYNYSIS